MWLESEWNDPPASDVSRLVRLDVATDATVEAEIPFAGAGRVVVLRGASPAADRIAVLRPTDAGTTLALYEPVAFAEVLAAADLPSVWDARGCADAGIPFVDLSRAPYEGWCFVDRVHMTDRGHDTAAAMLERMVMR